MDICRMEFDGKLLKRGFWLYVWDIKEDQKRRLYVGRTGDSSSPHASSPFRRIGQHLDTRLNAKGNALGRRLRSEEMNPEFCTFEMTAIGPIFSEQSDMPQHVPLRDQTAALERGLADELKRRGYEVLGTHPKAGIPDPNLMAQVSEKLGPFFPEWKQRDVHSPRYQPVTPLRNASASEIVLADRDRF